jgi:thiazole/oxazole-forming peptide maturase SagC family component
MADILSEWEASDRVRMKPPFHYVTVDANEVIIKGGTWSGPLYIIKDENKKNLVSPIVELLNGTHTLEYITDRLGVENEEDIMKFIYALNERQLIERVPEGLGEAALEPEEKQRLEPLFAFLSSITNQPMQTTTSRMRNSEVLLIGAGTIGARACMQLAQAGIGKLRLIDDNLIGREDTYSIPYYKADYIGSRRSEAMVGIVKDFVPTTSITAFNCDGKMTDEKLTEAAENCNWVIVATDIPDLLLYNKINKLALKNKFTWMMAALDGVDGLIGPTFIPYQTCCYVCYEMRLESNMMHYNAFKEYKTIVEKGVPGNFQSFVPGLMGISDIIAGFLTYECVRGIATEYAFTFGKVIRINFQSGMVETNDVLKLPRCPSCGKVPRGRPNEQLFYTFDKIVKELEI